MESAARNFRERIKNMAPDSNQLPNISTIHGLALRIIKDNSNYERLGLSPDFEICDDTQRMRILKSIDGKFTKTDLDDFDRAEKVKNLAVILGPNNLIQLTGGINPILDFKEIKEGK